jgi:hypothetical protein
MYFKKGGSRDSYRETLLLKYTYWPNVECSCYTILPIKGSVFVALPVSTGPAYRRSNC